jgi:hypothetical protein
LIGDLGTGKGDAMLYHTRAGEKRAILFRRANKDLEHLIQTLICLPEPGAIIDVIERPDGRLAIVIELSEDTRSDDLERAIPLALDWRNRLNQYQGLDWEWGLDKDKYDLEQEHRAGKSYEELAERMNARIEREFRTALDAAPYEKSDPSKLVSDILQEYRKYDPWRTRTPVPEPTSKTLGIGSALELLWAMGYQEDCNGTNGKEKRKRPNKEREEDIENVLESVFSRYCEGLPLFHKGYPLDGARMEATLKAFRQSKKYQLIEAQIRKAKPKHKRSGKN